MTRTFISLLVGNSLDVTAIKYRLIAAFGCRRSGRHNRSRHESNDRIHISSEPAATFCNHS
jgi:hypothetical protein